VTQTLDNAMVFGLETAPIPPLSSPSFAIAACRSFAKC
jgi:hypothetical protein